MPDGPSSPVAGATIVLRLQVRRPATLRPRLRPDGAPYWLVTVPRYRLTPVAVYESGSVVPVTPYHTATF